MRTRFLVSSCLVAMLALTAVGLKDSRAGIPEGKASHVTTLIIVRHAEKAGDGDDVDLTPVGYERSWRLATTLERLDIDAVFSSEKKRTYQTVRPIAETKSMEIQRVAEPADVVTALRALPTGSTAVLSHHSSTIHPILEGLGIPPDEAKSVNLALYDNLLIVLLHPKLEPTLVKLRF